MVLSRAGGMSCTAGYTGGVSGRAGTPSGKPPIAAGIWSPMLALLVLAQPAGNRAPAKSAAAAKTRRDRPRLGLDININFIPNSAGPTVGATWKGNLPAPSDQRNR